MRRLLLLVAVLVFVDTMLYAALTPLLPHFAHELSKTRAGALVAAYAAGALIGGLPGGCGRRGSARGAPCSSASRGWGSRASASRSRAASGRSSRRALLQGLGSAFTWAGAFAWLLAAAPRERRGAADRQRDGRRGLRRALRAGDRRRGGARRPRTSIFCALAGARGRARRLDAAARGPRRPASSRRPRRSCARFATGSSPAGSR